MQRRSRYKKDTTGRILPEDKSTDKETPKLTKIQTTNKFFVLEQQKDESTGDRETINSSTWKVQIEESQRTLTPK